MANNHTEIEKRLWASADELRANSKLKSSEYSVPVLGLIFLRYADHRFTQAEKELAGKGTGRRAIGKEDYQAKGVMYLPPQARFSHLLALPEGENTGKAINEAMKAVEAENEELKGVLPKSYTKIENPTLVALLKTFSTIPVDAEGDTFGKIYEYFLGNFALAEGQKGGEFFTPTSLVKLIVQIIEPYHGRIFDPACGSGGMFVQSADFIKAHKKNPSVEISVYGQERVDETRQLCLMNLAVHALSGDIRQGNTYYEDLHESVGKFDFVMANPPFNVDKVDRVRIKDDPRFPLGMPKADNANYLWIQLFYSALNSTGRAGFVIHNSANDSESEIRKTLLVDNAIDIVVTTSPNLFYTVNLPCSLWFLDKSRNRTKRKDHILFIDASRIYTQVDTVHRELSDEQVASIASLVRQFRKASSPDDFPSVPGLCRAVPLSLVAEKDNSLNPKLYVGDTKAAGHSSEELLALHEKLEELKTKASGLQKSIGEALGDEWPIDRGMILESLRLLYKRWFVTHDLDSLSASLVPTKPNKWKTIPFRKSLANYMGGTWGQEEMDDDHCCPCRVMRGTDMQATTFGETTSIPLRYVKKSQIASRRLSHGDIVIEVSGGGKEQTTGRTAIVSGELASRFGVPLTCASFCKFFRVDSSLILPSLVFGHLQHIYETGRIGKFEVQSTGIKNFRTEVFLDEETISIPPEPLQKMYDQLFFDAMTLVHVIGAMGDTVAELRRKLGTGVVFGDKGLPFHL